MNLKQALWSDGPKLEDVAVMEGPSGVLEDPEFFTGRGQEVSNAELLGIAQTLVTLQLARNIGGRTLVLLDSQAVIFRLQGRQRK